MRRSSEFTGHVVKRLFGELAKQAQLNPVPYGMPREVRNLILRRVRGWLQRQAAQTKGPLALDDSARTIVLGMIEAAQASPKAEDVLPSGHGSER